MNLSDKVGENTEKETGRMESILDFCANHPRISAIALLMMTFITTEVLERVKTAIHHSTPAPIVLRDNLSSLRSSLLEAEELRGAKSKIPLELSQRRKLHELELAEFFDHNNGLSEEAFKALITELEGFKTSGVLEELNPLLLQIVKFLNPKQSHVIAANFIFPNYPSVEAMSNSFAEMNQSQREQFFRINTEKRASGNPFVNIPQSYSKVKPGSGLGDQEFNDLMAHYRYLSQLPPKAFGTSESLVIAGSQGERQ